MATTKVSGQLVDLNEATSENGLKMPSGTELNRPTDATGQIRNNTNETSNGASSAMEYYNGADWKKITTKALLPPTQTYTQNTYSGNSSSNRVFNPGFTPDLVMIKSTNYYEDWILSYRGFGENYIRANNAGAKVLSTMLRVDQATGFRTTGLSPVNNSAGYNYIYYAWKANGGTYSSNTDGTITSSVQSSAGTAAAGSLDQGFSVVRYTGNATASQTVGHGLDGTPEFIIVKNVDTPVNWACYHVGLGVDKYFTFNTGAEVTSNGIWAGTNDSVFGVNTASEVNNNGDNLVAFCFKSVAGYSKFGSYTGTGAAGNAQDLGFEPGLILVRATGGSSSLRVYSSSSTGQRLQISSTVPYSADTSITFTSTGFEFTGSGNNAAATEYIYMAFDKNV